MNIRIADILRCWKFQLLRYIILFELNTSFVNSCQLWLLTIVTIVSLSLYLIYISTVDRKETIYHVGRLRTSFTRLFCFSFSFLRYFDIQSTKWQTRYFCNKPVTLNLIVSQLDRFEGTRSWNQVFPSIFLIVSPRIQICTSIVHNRRNPFRLQYSISTSYREKKKKKRKISERRYTHIRRYDVCIIGLGTISIFLSSPPGRVGFSPRFDGGARNDKGWGGEWGCKIRR